MTRTEIGNKITQLRKERKMTRNMLANLSGISPTYIAQLEQGLRNPTVEYLSYVCDALNVSLALFFAEESNFTRWEKAISKLTPEQQENLLNFIEKL